MTSMSRCIIRPVETTDQQERRAMAEAFYLKLWAEFPTAWALRRHCEYPDELIGIDINPIAMDWYDTVHAFDLYIQDWLSENGIVVHRRPLPWHPLEHARWIILDESQKILWKLRWDMNYWNHDEDRCY